MLAWLSSVCYRKGAPDNASPVLPQALGCWLQDLQVPVKCLASALPKSVALRARLAHCPCSSHSPASSHYPQSPGPSRHEVTATAPPPPAASPAQDCSGLDMTPCPVFASYVLATMVLRCSVHLISPCLGWQVHREQHQMVTGPGSCWGGARPSLTPGLEAASACQLR